MDQEKFVKRLIELRLNKGVFARDMSLSLGQSAGYINNIENGINYPSMSLFFYICEYFGITPEQFFNTIYTNPEKLNKLCDLAKDMSDEQLDILIAVASGFKK